MNRNSFAELDVEGIDTESESLVDRDFDDVDDLVEAADVAAESALSVPSKAENCLGSGSFGYKNSCKSDCKGCKRSRECSKKC